MRLVIVSNRLPLVLEMVDGTWRTQPGAGGLIAALTPILQRQSGVWIGWSGASDVDQTDELQRTLDEYQRDAGFELIPVAMTSQEVEGFYRGFSNEIIWPLFHDLQSFCNFVPDYWTTYLAVNDKFAEIVAQHAQPDDLLWVQDYHLMGLGRQLRRRGLRNRLAFFLHIPFPPPDIFEKLPWRVDVLEGLLKYDVLGFQTPRDRKNFADCVRDLLPDARQRRRHGGLEVRWGGQTTFVRHFPIGIDYQALAQGAALPSVATHAEEIRREMPGEQLVLGLDRLDHTKGIPYRLRAFGRALERFEDLHRKVTLPAGSRTQPRNRAGVPGAAGRNRAARHPDQRRLYAARLGPNTLRISQPGARGAVGILLRGRRGAGHASERWHEPGGQGVLCLPARR